MASHSECKACGQPALISEDANGLCSLCYGFDRKPSGEALRLFAPAPEQLPGQLVMDDEPSS